MTLRLIVYTISPDFWIPKSSFMSERLKIPGQLRPDARATYMKAFVSLQQARHFEDSQDKVCRLSDSRFARITQGIRESNLDHVVEALGMVRELEGLPHFAKAVDLGSVGLSVVVHDVGESYCSSDVAAAGPDRENPYGRRIKEMEPRLARRVISQIKDPSIRTQAQDLYDRFLAQDPYDTVSLTARFIDKAQGTTRGGARAYDPNRWWDLLDNDEERYALLGQLKSHTALMLEGVTKPLVLLARVIPDQARHEIIDYAVSEVINVRDRGYSEEAERVIQELGKLKHAV